MQIGAVRKLLEWVHRSEGREWEWRERERRVDLFKLKNIAHKKTQENDRILKSLNNFISNSNIDPEIISFFQHYVC